MRGKVCAVFGCSNYEVEKKARSFFHFTRNKKMCDLWVLKFHSSDLDNVYQKEGTLRLYKNYKICSDHFQASDFKNPRLYSQGVAYPKKLATTIEADSLQKLIMKFSLKDKNTGKPMTVHQAFVKLQNEKTKQEIIFVAEPDSSRTYKFDMDVGSKAAEFGHLSGPYSLELIVGDAVLSNSFSWQVATVNLKFADQAPSASSVKDPYLYTLKPEIQHLFREPERRPPVFVSNLFTGLVAVPLLLLLALWAKLGVNISNFPFSLPAVGFHLGLGVMEVNKGVGKFVVKGRHSSVDVLGSSCHLIHICAQKAAAELPVNAEIFLIRVLKGIFALFGIFWLQLNMFQTIKYLLGIGIVTFLCGNKMLAKIASERRNR